MSTEEKIRREEYKQKRKFKIIVQSIVIAIVTFVMLILLVPFNKYNENSYVEYQENVALNYNVYIEKDEFYKEDYIPGGNSYLSEIIDYFEIEFSSNIDLEETNASYNYSYDVEAHLEITSGTNGSTSVLYKHIKEDDPIHESKSNLVQTGSDFIFNKKVVVDYDYYNNKALEYLSVYKPSNVTSTLVVSFKLNKVVSLGDYTNTGSSVSNVSLRIPLATTIVKPEIRGLSSSNETNKILVNQDYSKLKAYKTSLIVLGVIDAILVAVLCCFIYLTRNHDINYNNKVNKIVRTYRSFIQKILNNLDTSKYQVLYIETINELLEIRDTLQMPILMYENEDKTCTNFMIPTDGGTLYMFEIKVDDYDELYNTPIEEEVIEEFVQEAEEKEDVVEEKKIIRHNYSFESRLILSTQEQKDCYYSIAEFIKTYGVILNRSWSRERVYTGRKTLASINYRGKTLCISFPLDPNDEKYRKYYFKNMSEVKTYKDTPALMKITSNRKVKYAIQLLEEIFIQEGLINKKHEVKIEKVKSYSKKTLIKKGLIKLG